MIAMYELLTQLFVDILRCTRSRTEFKRELKTHLFSPYE